MAIVGRLLDEARGASMEPLSEESGDLVAPPALGADV